MKHAYNIRKIKPKKLNNDMPGERKNIISGKGH
jgi:hypothetical protein